MIQLVVNDIFLDLYDEDLPKLTLSVEDITTTDTTTAFSRTFRVPATKKNTEYFQTLFSINGRDFDVTAKQPATILIDGNEYKKGEIRLQEIFISPTTGRIDYGIIFLGELKGFASAVGQATMNQLDFSELAHDFTRANVVTSWQAYPETPSTQTSGLLQGAIIYPLIDFGNTYDDDLVAEQTLISAKGGNQNGKFIHDNSVDWLNINRLRPMIKAKDIWDKIFDNTDFTYESNFLDSNIFRHLYIGAFGNDAEFDLFSNYYGYIQNSFEIYEDEVTKIPITLASNNQGFWDFANGVHTWEVPEDGDYDIVARVRLDSVFTEPAQLGAFADYRLRIRKYNPGGADTTLASTTLRVTPTQTYFAFYRGVAVIQITDTYTLTAGDEYYIDIELYNKDDWYYSEVIADLANNGLPLTRFQIEQSFAENPGVALADDFKQIDFIRGIINKFRLVMVPDRDDVNKFIIEPWSSYIGTGTVYDWTQKLDESKDISIKPIFNTQKKSIKFEDKKGDDFLNIQNDQIFGETYGTLNFDAQTPLITGDRTIKTDFTATAVATIPDAEQANDGMDNTIIPQIYDNESALDSSNNALILRRPVKPGVRLLWWDGLKHSGTTSGRDDDWYLTDDGSTRGAFSKIPMCSEFNEWGDRDDSWQGLDTQTQTLNWQKENTYIRFNLAQENLGISVYDAYWSSYINALYNAYSRRLTAYFLLDTDDLLDINFDDVIFVKDAYYYIEKVYDVTVGQTTPVKVDLIKLNNYMPSPDNFANTWPTIEELWNGISTEWQDL